MRMCNGCAHAEWKRTAAGRLHPSKEGRCRHVWKAPPLPNCRYFLGQQLKEIPEPVGGFIERGHEYENHCPYYQRDTGATP